MIVAAGLTPAWQQILRFDRLHPGEVNRAVESHWCASGKSINVGLALTALGAPALAVSPRGGWSGQALADALSRQHLPARWIQTQAPTRVCTTVVDDAAGTVTELVENAAPLADAEHADFVAVYHEATASADVVVLSGSLPSGTPSTFYRDLLRRTACPAVVDGRGPELLAALESRPRLVKPNREELARTLGRPLADDDSLRAGMRELLDRGAGAVVVTQGTQPVWVAEGARFWKATPPPVACVVNPIGCGDCLAAGLALGLSRGGLLDAVRLGLAAAADNVGQLLPARVDLRRVLAWQERIVLHEV